MEGLCSSIPCGFEVSVLCRFCLFMSSSFVLFLCVSAHAYLYTRVCVCLCIHHYTNHMYTCVFLSRKVCFVFVCECACVFTCVRACVCVRVYIYKYVRIAERWGAGVEYHFQEI